MKIYFSQADSRWANKMYSIRNDKSQTMKTSGCGPTSASMIVFNLTDNRVYPDEMADLYVKNKFRTSSNGTDTSAFKWTANKYGLTYNMTRNLDNAIKCLKEGGMVIARCTNGLFTLSGHYIVLADYDGEHILVYDPYIYKNKFTTNGRSGKVIQDGNYVYITKNNMLNYGNAKEYYLFRSKEEEMRYNTISEVPVYAKGTIMKLMNLGYLMGDGKGLNLSEDMIRIFVILDRAGKFDN